MRKLLLLCLLLVSSSLTGLLAQERTVTGKVTAADDGAPLPGVNVVVRGSTTGTTTDAAGRYSLSAPGNATLVFSFIGLVAQEVPVGNRTTLDVVMRSDVQQLSEVVVNAIGVETSRDKLGTTVTTVQGNAVTRSGETSVLNGLAGKAPGVNITRNGGDPGAGTYIQLRGQSTITGNLQPLIVIDGMPMFNSYIDSGDPALNGNAVGGTQQQSRLSDLNPDDIASIEVLKGAAAGALWGSRAANGVLVITTKKGQNSGGRINVGYRGTLSLDEVNRLPELQTAFGQGRGGRFTYGNPRSWGDRIADRPGGPDTYNTAAGQPYVEFPDGTRRYRVANGTAANPHGGKNSREVYDHGSEVFRTGRFFDHSLSLNGGNERSNFFASYSNLSQQGIIRNNSDYYRNTARVNASTLLTDKIRASVNATFSNVRSNRAQQGSNVGGIFLGGLRTPPDYNNALFLGTYVDPEGVTNANRQVSYRQPIGASTNPGFDNPFWTIRNNRSNTSVNRLIGNTELSYDILSWLNLRANVGVDTYSDRRSDFINAESAISPGGSYTEQTIGETQWNTNLFARATRRFSGVFSGSALVGFNYNSRQFNAVGANVLGFIVPNAPPNLLNSDPNTRTAFNDAETVRTSAGFTQLDAELFDQLFLTATGRIEAASTFGPEANSVFFYPSLSAAWQFTKALGASNALSFGKLRASYGIVGRQPDAYLNLTTYVPTSYVESWGGTLSGSQYGVGGYSRSLTAGNPNIRPERKSEVEGGLDLRFLNDRIGFSATAYYNRTTDAILAVDVAASTGFSSQVQNAAEIENRGLEFSLEPRWVGTKHFTWSSNFIWFNYRNKVLSLSGAESVFLTGGGFSDGSSRAVEGQPLGVLWGTYYGRNENGGYNLDANGFPRLAANEGIIGNPNPNYRASIGNTFTFYGFTLNALFDFQVGGQVWNGTRGALINYGTHKDTEVETTVSAAEAAQIRTFSGATLAGLANIPAQSSRVRINPDGSYTFRGTVGDFGGGPVALDEAWYTGPGGGFGVNGPFVEDGSWSRLRELSLSYTLNSAGFRKATRFSSVSLSVTGRNLALWTDYKGIDPETNLTGANNGRGIDYFQNPNTRSVLFTVSLNY